MRKVWSALLEFARFVWETREAFRRPGEAPRGGALKSREDRTEREFSAASGARRGSSRSSMADRNRVGGLGPTEMRRHACRHLYKFGSRPNLQHHKGLGKVKTLGSKKAQQQQPGQALPNFDSKRITCRSLGPLSLRRGHGTQHRSGEHQAIMWRRRHDG